MPEWMHKSFPAMIPVLKSEVFNNYIYSNEGLFFRGAFKANGDCDVIFVGR
jgi:hypothetical protein